MTQPPFGTAVPGLLALSHWQEAIADITSWANSLYPDEASLLISWLEHNQQLFWDHADAPAQVRAALTPNWAEIYSAALVLARPVNSDYTYPWRPYISGLVATAIAERFAPADPTWFGPAWHHTAQVYYTEATRLIQLTRADPQFYTFAAAFLPTWDGTIAELLAASQATGCTT